MNELTELEQKALNAAKESQIGNGGDFGLVSDMIDSLESELNAHQVGALFSSLEKKMFFDWTEEFRNENGKDTQFCLLDFD